MLRFWVNHGQDPKGTRLREMLSAQFSYERMQVISALLVYALVVIGVLVWIAAVQPGLLPSWLSQLSEAAWGAGLLGLILAIVRGRLCEKRARRLAEESQSPERHPSPNEPA